VQCKIFASDILTKWIYG